MTRARALWGGAAALAAGAALLAAGCGGGSGQPKAAGDTKDARVAAQLVIESLRASTPGLQRVTCSALDFALTYRCDAERKADAGESLVCSVHSGASGAGGLGADANVAKPYCITAAADAAERARRDTLISKALDALRTRSRLATVVVGIRHDGFEVGCNLGFITTKDGARQTDDVVLLVTAVSVDTGRSVWDAFTVPAGGGKVTERSGVSPADKPPLNPFGKCALDDAGAPTVVTDDVRDVALLPGA